MSDAISTPGEAAPIEPIKHAERDESPRGVTFRVLASALKDVRQAEDRYRIMYRPVGLHGETYGARWDKVRNVVVTHNRKAVAAAWDAAIKAGWTEKDLSAAGLARA